MGNEGYVTHQYELDSSVNGVSVMKHVLVSKFKYFFPLLLRHLKGHNEVC
jgi:hypothetical protein